MKLFVLASGSRGNCAVLTNGDYKLMIDCGIPLKEVRRRLRAVGETETGFQGVLLTHAHGDHASHAVEAAKRYHCPIYISEECVLDSTKHAFNGHRYAIKPNVWFDRAGISICPISVPHEDGSVGFVFQHLHRKLTFFCDCGHITLEMVNMSRGANVIAIEADYDTETLVNRQLPPAEECVRSRTMSSNGHLSNKVMARFLGYIDAPDLHTVVLIHLSRKNNTPELARKAAEEGLARFNPMPKILVAGDEPLPGIEI